MTKEEFIKQNEEAFKAWVSEPYFVELQYWSASLEKWSDCVMSGFQWFPNYFYRIKPKLPGREIGVFIKDDGSFLGSDATEKFTIRQLGDMGYQWVGFKEIVK